jgi:xanthine/uracil permease
MHSLKRRGYVGKFRTKRVIRLAVFLVLCIVAVERYGSRMLVNVPVRIGRAVSHQRASAA